VAVHEHDRVRLEQLARYLLRPPLALDRLSLLGEEYVCLALKKPWADRTTHVTMSASAFLGRLASLVPRPRANTTLYFGVLAANAKHRDAIVPRRDDDAEAKRARPDSSWAALMKYSFGLDVLACPRCGDRLAFSAVLVDRREVRRLLEHLSIFNILPASPLARGPPDPHDSLCFA
jgi:hypothetical protein